MNCDVGHCDRRSYFVEWHWDYTGFIGHSAVETAKRNGILRPRDHICASGDKKRGNYGKENMGEHPLKVSAAQGQSQRRLEQRS